MWTCPGCGTEIDDFSNECCLCRHKKPLSNSDRSSRQETWTCLACGSEIEVTKKACVCGYQRINKQQAGTAGKGQSLIEELQPRPKLKTINIKKTNSPVWAAFFLLSGIIIYLAEAAIIFSGSSQPPLYFIAGAFGFALGQMPIDLLLGGLVLIVLKFMGVYRRTGIWRFLTLSLFVGFIPGLFVRRWIIMLLTS